MAVIWTPISPELLDRTDYSGIQRTDHTITNVTGLSDEMMEAFRFSEAEYEAEMARIADEAAEAAR